jgi:hydrogenase maturation factor HypF (carbamoyltransferase family)
MSNSNPTPSDKNREFITILIRGPEKGFNEFIEELRKDSVYVTLVDQIHIHMLTYLIFAYFYS